ncbi:MAG: helix-turn-helix domain-containing protein [Desulfurococcales archaeon]|nr:helix-turn-helix domain-containing protein [Desulfurococcales archaeon]
MPARAETLLYSLAMYTIIFISIFYGIVSYSLHGYNECSLVLLHVYPDGSVLVEERIEVDNAPSSVTVDLLGPALYLSAVDEGGTPPPIEYNDTTAVIDTYANGSITLSYYTLNLTRKEGTLWILRVDTECDTIVVLSDPIVPVEMEPTPAPVSVGNVTGFEFEDGVVYVKYYVLPSSIASRVQGSPRGYGAATSGGASVFPGPWHKYIAITVLFITIFIASWVLYRRYVKRLGGVKVDTTGTITRQLDDRDTAILKALEAGPKTATEIMQETGIPKTPLYRRLKKLAEAGYIEAVDERGVRRYKLKTR